MRKIGSEDITKAYRPYARCPNKNDYVPIDVHQPALSDDESTETVISKNP